MNNDNVGGLDLLDVKNYKTITLKTGQYWLEFKVNRSVEQNREATIDSNILTFHLTKMAEE